MALTTDLPAWWPGQKKASAADTPHNPGGSSSSATLPKPAKFAVTEPRVNLVPPDVLHRARSRRDRRTGVVVWTAAAAVCLGWWYTGFTAQQSASDALAQQNERGQALAADLAHYAPVTSIAEQTQALQDTVASQTEEEIDHSEVMSRFLAATSGLMTTESVNITTDGPGTCVSTDPFQKVPLSGCVQFSGKGADEASASKIVAALSADPWLADAFIPTVGANDNEGGGTPISGTVGLTMNAFATGAPTDTADDTGDGEAAAETQEEN